MFRLLFFLTFFDYLLGIGMSKLGLMANVLLFPTTSHTLLLTVNSCISRSMFHALRPWLSANT